MIVPNIFIELIRFFYGIVDFFLWQYHIETELTTQKFLFQNLPESWLNYIDQHGRDD